ncbi:MAG: DUF3179 domain-containing protein [Solirubrobacterales bacterium]|nr:DUF3179 domain-containing protein [Solirubrobacterales bacterium]
MGFFGRRSMLAGALLVPLALVACGGDNSGEDDRPATPPGLSAGFSTDFSKHSVPLDQFAGGGPPKDGIPAIDDPKFVSVPGADGFLVDKDPVAVLEIGGATRIYPIQILVWHEIVNDTVGGEPVAVTYCPLCSSTVAFSRDVEGQLLDFGTTGRVRKSDLVMYDRQTESWWQQLTAEAVVGELTGTELKVLPSGILSWGEARKLHPGAEVLSRDTGTDRDYGSTPYRGYDQPDSTPFLLDEEADPRLPPKARVTTIRTGADSAVVYPLETLKRQAPVNDEVDGRPVVIFFDSNVASPLDQPQISSSREVGSSAVFSRKLNGRVLDFSAAGRGLVRDRQTGTTWDLSGRGTKGPLEGEQLKRVAADDQFWFAVAAFYTDADIRTGASESTQAP